MACIFQDKILLFPLTHNENPKRGFSTFISDVDKQNEIINGDQYLFNDCVILYYDIRLVSMAVTRIVTSSGQYLYKCGLPINA